MHRAAIAWAVAGPRWSRFRKLRCRQPAMARNTVSKARLALGPARTTSLGSATIGHDSSMLSRCARETGADDLGSERGGLPVDLDALPGVLPARIREEVRQRLDIEIALACEI